VDLRYRRPHPAGTGSGEHGDPALHLRLRHRRSDRIRPVSELQHTFYQPKGRFTRWLEARLPIIGFSYNSFVSYPTPRNLNYLWSFGAILTFMLGAQIATGIVLAMHYIPDAASAFTSVEHIMRDVNYGWLIRYLHSNGASMFFIAVYVHMFRS